MSDLSHFAALLAVAAAVGLAAIYSNRASVRIGVPAPALFLIAAALAVQFVPSLHAPTEKTVERLLTVALVAILFEGGLQLGWSRLSGTAGAILSVGVIGTLLTTAAVGVVAHLALGVSWYEAVLVGTAVAPTDPAVVFSVLGRREIAGRTGTLLEGESGANDPVGIAMMVGLLGASNLSGSSLIHVLEQFALQMSVGTVFGVGGGVLILWSIRRVSLPSAGLYPVRTLTCALLLYGMTAVAHGSGFLAVFIAGIVISDRRAPFKREVERFHAALASLAEIIAFIALGLTVSLAEIRHLDVWFPALVVAVTLCVLIRPLLVGLCLLGSGLRRNERAFVLFAGLKGAVPIVLGGYILTARVDQAARLYAVVVVVVTFSVIVQGGLVPTAARLLRIDMTVSELEPWALGVRLRSDPSGTHRFKVRPGSRAVGATVAEVARATSAWISLVVRDGDLVAVDGGTVLAPGDDVLALAPEGAAAELQAAFEAEH